MIKMPAGRYYIGDLCYVMNDVWDEFCDLMFPENGDGSMVQGKLKLKDGRQFVVYSTAYGDGCYEDNYGRSYPVDAGLIGCILVDDIRDESGNINSGNIVEFTDNFVTDGYEGYMKFGAVSIDTGCSYEDENY